MRGWWIIVIEWSTWYSIRYIIPSYHWWSCIRVIPFLFYFIHWILYMLVLLSPFYLFLSIEGERKWKRERGRGRGRERERRRGSKGERRRERGGKEEGKEEGEGKGEGKGEG